MSAAKQKYKPYPKYKDSGVDWLGQVPEHWSTAPLFAAYTLGKRTGHIDEPLLSVYRDHGVIYKDSRDDNHNKASDDLSNYQLVEPGCLVTNKMKTWQGSIAISELRGIVSPAYFVYTPTTEQNRQYTHNLLRSLPYISGYLASSKGIRVGQWDLDPQLFRVFPILIPPPAEQTAIADFIECECGRMDKLVEKKQQFIALLKEKRQALITHAVTKGLNPKAKMKDSGVEWLGMVPEHWEVKPFFSTMVQHKEPNTGLREDNILSLSYGRIIRRRQTNEGLLPASYETYQIVKPGYIVFRLTDLQNDKNSLRSGLVREKGAITSAYLAVEPKSHHSKYFDYLFRGYDVIKVYYSMGGGLRQSLGYEDMRRMPLLLPPDSEKKEIETYLTNQTSRIDRLIAKTEKSIDLLKERKTALITAAVTGQIDVSQAA